MNPLHSMLTTKIGSKIGINEKTQQTAIDILRKAEEKKAIAGKDPMGIAAAAIYIATSLNGEFITQREIAEAAGVTEVTVRNRYKGLVKSLGLNLKKTIIKIAYMNA